MESVSVAIIDLDNCISNDEWRLPLIDDKADNAWDKYAKYHDACAIDDWKNLHVVWGLAADHKLIVFTSRPHCEREKTARWLKRNDVNVELLVMRPIGNHQPSVDLKRSMLRNLDAKYKPAIAIDDRVDILNMYSEEGVPICRRVFIYNVREEARA